MAKYPLLYKGLTTGWIQKFFLEPFDPICIMLAMRTKLLLDVIDEMGHSFNLLRSLQLGWIDFGVIPGETPGDPSTYYPPEFLNPIVLTPQPDAPRPGQPGYVPQTAPPPGAAPIYGGGPGANSTGSMISPWGFGLGPDDLGGRAGGGGGFAAWNCCLDKDNPESYVHIGYNTLKMNCGENQGLTVTGYKEGCLSAAYTWDISQGSGSLDTSVEFMATYTAPAGGAGCESPVVINLYCYEALVSSIIIVLNPCPAAGHINYTTQQMAIDEAQTLNAAADTPGCGTPVFNWAITAGGGSLSVTQGAATVYTAPHTNAGCANNPIIQLSCGDTVLDTLQIAVNASADGGVAVRECITHTCPPCPTQSGYCGCCRRDFRCWGALIPNGSTTMCICMWPYAGGENWSAGTCVENGWIDGFKDMRTEAMIAGGCCPAQLL